MKRRFGVGVLVLGSLLAAGCGGHKSSSKGSTAAPASVATMTVTAVLPATGDPAGGTAVAVEGTGFQPGTATVRFGTVAAANVVVRSETLIECVTPAGAAGAIDVTVVNDGRTVRLPGGFTYTAPPPTLDLTSVAPSTGPIAGGTTVNLVGTGFSQGTLAVTFGGIAAGQVTVLHDRSAVCVTPVSAVSGSVDVEITNTLGTARLPNAFTYTTPTQPPAPAPTLTAINPSQGTTAGGERVTLSGTGFLNAGTPRVEFGATSALSVVVVSDVEVTCSTPAGVAGVVRVTLTNTHGAVSLANAFTYVAPPPAAPTLAGVLPTDGPTSGNTSVQVAGSGFLAGGATTVTFGGAQATNVVVVSDRVITCRTPASAAGAVTVRITNSNGSASQPNVFTFHGPPALTSVTPSSGATTGGERISVIGSGFANAGVPTVELNAIPARNVTVVSDTELTCDTPAGTAGAASLTVRTAYGVATLPAAFAYVGATPPPAAPTLATVGPNFGPESGGQRVILRGTGFTTGGSPQLRFGTAAVTSFTIVNDGEAQVMTPAGTGRVAITFTNAHGTATLSAAFTYWAPSASAPSLASISPTRGPAAGATGVVIRGTGFSHGPITVTFDGVASPSIAVNGDTQIVCSTPPGAKGPVDVVVRNANGTDVLAGGFTYELPAGTVTTIAGTGTGGFFDNVPALQAQFNDLSDVAQDARGNLFVADSYNHRVRKIDAAGNVTTVAGFGPQGSGQGGFSGDGGPAAQARLQYPNHVAFDKAGNLWVMDGLNNRVRRLTPDPATGEVGPNSTIDSFVGKGPTFSFVGGFSGDGGPCSDAELGFPKAFCFDKDGNMLIADRMNSRVRKVFADPTTGLITKQSRIETIAGSGSFGLISGGYSGDGGPATQALLSHPAGIACDASGNVYVADTMNNVIRKVDTHGIITTVVGVAGGSGSFSGDGGLAITANLWSPWGLAVDGSGNLFVCDNSNRRVRKVTAVNGQITPTNGASIDSVLSGYLNRGLTVTSGGDLLVAGGAANVVLEVTSP